MKKLRRSLALLLIAAILVNSTDFSLLTVNAEEQTATEGEVPSGNNESSEEQDAEAQSSETGNTEAEGEEAAPPEDGSGDAAGPAEGQDGSDGTVSQPGTGESDGSAGQPGDGETGDPAGQPGTGETDGSAGQPADDGSEGMENSGSDGAENPPVSDEDQGTNKEPGSGENPDTSSDDGESEDAQDGTSDADTPSGEEQVPAVPGAEQPVDPDQVLPPANLAPSLPEETDEETVPTIIGVDFTDEDKAAYVLNQTVPIGAALDAVLLPETVIGIVDAADGADGEEAADETVELTVSEWVITGPEGATKFDTSASEEDENVPKQGFYEFAPVLADLPEGYEWSETVPGGYDTWDEYLENWMKISVTVGAENALNREEPEIAVGGNYTFSFREIATHTTGDLIYTNPLDPGDTNSGKVYAHWDAATQILILKATGDATFNFVPDSDYPGLNASIQFDSNVGNPTINLNGGTITGSMTNPAPVLNFANADNVTLNLNSATTLSGFSGSAIEIGDSATVTIDKGTLTLEGFNTSGGLINNNGTLNINGSVNVNGSSGTVNNSGTISVNGSLEITTSIQPAVTGGNLNISPNAVFLAKTSIPTVELLENVTLTGSPCLSGKFSGYPVSEITVVSENDGSEAAKISLSTGSGTAMSFIRNLPAGTYNILGEQGGVEFKYAGTPESGGEETSDFEVPESGIGKYININQVLLPVFWQAHGEDISFDSAVLVGEVDTAHDSNHGNQPMTNWGFKLVKVTDENGDDVEIDNAFSENNEYIHDKNGNIIFVADTKPPSPQPGIDDAGTTFSRTISGLKEKYTYTFIPCVETKFGWEMPTDDLLEQTDDKKPTPSNSAFFDITPLYLNWPDKIELTYGEILGDLNTAGKDSELHPSLSMTNQSIKVETGALISADQSGLGVAGSFYVYRGSQAEGDLTSEQKTDQQNIWPADEEGRTEAHITFVPADGNVAYSQVSQKVTVIVHKRELTVTELNNAEREYDGTTELTSAQSQGIKTFIPLPHGNEDIDNCTSINDQIQSDGIYIVQEKSRNIAGTYSQRDAGESIDITLNGLSIMSDSENAADNYTIESTIKLEDAGKITPRKMTLVPKKEEIETGENIPTFTLEVAQDSPNAEYGADDQQDAVIGTPEFTVEGWTEYDPNKMYPSTYDYTVKTSLTGSSSNYEFKVKDGTLTVIQNSADRLYTISGQKNEAEWYDDEQVKISPKEDSGYTHIRIGVQNGDEAISWGEWKTEYVYSSTAENLVIQLGNENGNGAFTSWTSPISLQIDAVDPIIADVTYKEKDSGDGSFIENVINFLSFGNYYKGVVVVTVEIEDTISGPKSLWHNIGSVSDYTEVAVSEEDGKYYASFEIPTGENQVLIEIEDIAGNRMAASLTKDSGEGQNALESTKWIIDTDIPVVSISSEGMDVTGKDGQVWYHSNVTLSVEANDTSALQALYEKIGDANDAEVWNALTKNQDGETESYTYEKTITDNTKGTTGTTYSYFVTDLAGNTSAEQNITIRIDKNKPFISDLKTEPADWYKDSGQAKISFHVSDEESGIYSVEIAKTIGANNVSIENPDYTNITDTSADGNYTYSTSISAGTYSICVTDVSGWVTEDTVTVDKLDTAAPQIENISAVDPGKTGENQWNNQNVTLAVEALDPASSADSAQSGLKEIQYTLDGEKWTSVSWESGDTVQFTLTENGQHTVKIKAVDQAGNESETREVIVYIDETQPELSMTASLEGGDSYTAGTSTNKAVQFTYNVSNLNNIQSGVTYWIRVGREEGTWMKVEDFVAQHPGGYSWDSDSHTLTVGYVPEEGGSFAVDDIFDFRVTTGSGLEDTYLFGNVKVTKVTLKQPGIVLTPENGMGGTEGWYYENDSILTVSVEKVTGSLDYAAEIHTYYKYWSGNDDSQAVNGEIDDARYTGTFEASGEYTFQAWAVDEAGNRSAVAETQFKVDRVKPKITNVSYHRVNDTQFAEFLNTISFGIFFNESIEVTVSTSDDLSGVASLKYCIGEGQIKTLHPNNGSFIFTLPVNETSDIVSMTLYDKAGNNLSQNLGTELENVDNPVWMLENDPPAVTDLKVNGQPAAQTAENAAWYNDEVTVTASVTDDESGIQKVEYDIGKGSQEIGDISSTQPEEEYSFKQKITEEGIHHIWVGAVDLAGNSTPEGGRASGVVKIDRTDPVIGEPILSTPADAWTNTPNTVTFTAQDLSEIEGIESSGIKNITVTRIQDGLGQSQNESVECTLSGDHTYQFTASKTGTYQIMAKDNAGNTVTQDVKIANIDTLKPVESTGNALQIPDNTEKNDDGTYTADEVPVYVYVKDPSETADSAQSGIKEYDWFYVPADDSDAVPVASGNNVQWKDGGENRIIMNMTGVFDLTVTVRDNAGNKETFTLSGIKINNGRPLLNVSASQYKDSESSPYKDSDWTNADYVVYQLGLQAGADDSNVLYWAKDADNNTTDFSGYQEISEYAQQIGAVWDSEEKTFTVSEEGSHAIIFCVTNNIQENPSAVLKTCKIDQTSPEKIDAWADGIKESSNNDWFQNQWPKLILGELDPDDFLENNAPVEIQYKIWKSEDAEPTEWNTTQGSDTAETKLANIITEDGTYTFRWRVSDEAGNTSDDAATAGSQTITVKVDSTDPVKEEITVAPEDTSILSEIINNIFGNFANTKVKVTVKASDVTSGLRELKYQVEDGNVQTVPFNEGVAEFTIDPSRGLYSKQIQIAYVDKAGNETSFAPIVQGTYSPDKWTIEGQAPTISQFEITDGTKGKDDWYTSQISISMVVEDVGGLAEVAIAKVQNQQVVSEKWYSWSADLVQGGQSLPTIHRGTAATTEDEQGTITYTLKAKDIAGNEITAGAPITVKIDTVAPVVMKPELISTDIAGADEWTNEDRVYRFTVTENTSGIDADSITISGPDGKVYGAVPAEEENTWTFHAPVNGTYTVSVSDKAGNTGTSEAVEVNKIDKNLPPNPTVEIIPIKPEEQEWYTDSDNAYVVLRPVSSVGVDESPDHTYYTLQKEGDTGEPKINEVTDNYPTQALDSGIWKLKVWSEDDAGNVCKSTFEQEIKVDNELPVIDTSGITFTDGNTFNFARFINWLSFGNFFNKEVVVTVPVSDQTSHLRCFWYQIGDGDPISVNIENEPTEAEVTFRIPVQENEIELQEIKIWAEDIAGNTSDQDVRLLKGQGESGSWMIEQKGPTVTVKVADSSSLNSETGWYLTSITLTGTAQDTNSGLNQVIWKKTTNDISGDVTELDLATNKNKSWILDERSYSLELEDGIHKVYLQATDNSTNTNNTSEMTYKVDSVPPTLKAEGFHGEDPVNERQLITITASDVTSGVLSGSLIIEYETTDGQHGQITQGDYENGEYYYVTYSGKEAIFYADKDAEYTISVKDKAGNVKFITGKNHLIEQLQGEEKVMVNNQPGENGKESSPWYNDFPTVSITTPPIGEGTNAIDIYTVWYLADPDEGEVFSDGENMLVKDSAGKIQYSNKITAQNEIGVIKNIAGSEGDTVTVTIPENYFSGVNQDGNWILYAQSVDEAENIGQLSKYYISIDRGTPTISKPEVAAANVWTKEKKISFTITDPYAYKAPQREDSISGLNGTDNVKIISPSGNETYYTPLKAHTSTISDYVAHENGTYKIIVKDRINAKNLDGTTQEAHTNEITFEVTHIDTDIPDNATVATQNPDSPNGNKVEGADGFNWYITSRPDIVITAPTQPTENVAPNTGSGVSLITTHYEIKCNGTDLENGEIQPNASEQTVIYHPQQDGKWEITTWTVDAAGNESGKATSTFYIDQEAPDIVTEDIKVEKINDSGLPQVVNRLSFGIFFQEGIRITVPVKEPTKTESGVAGLSYKLEGETGEQKAELKRTDPNTGISYYSFTIETEYAGTITLITEDKAGNRDETAKMTGDIVNGENTVTDWIIDLTDPQITVTPTANANEYGWYDDSLSLNVKVEGGVSGVREATWTLQYAEEEAQQQPPILDSDSVTEIQSLVDGTVTIGKNTDGKYTAVFYAKDNSLREARTHEFVYLIDKIDPVYTVLSNPDEWDDQKTIRFKVEDKTSGIRKDSITVTLNGEQISLEKITTEHLISEKDGNLSELAEYYECSFIAVENGIYTVSALDAAGHEVCFTISVNKIDREQPAVPTIKVNNSETVKTWYNGSVYPIVSGEKNATDNVQENVAPVKTMYKLWNREVIQTEPEGQVLIQTGNENMSANTPGLTTDGQWTVIMWNVDDAGNESEKITKTFYVDTVRPVINDQTVQPGENDPYVQSIDVKFTLNDPQKTGTGHGAPSGINEDTLSVTFTPRGETESAHVNRDTIQGPDENGVYTIHATENGEYTIQVSDTAGNSAVPVKVTLTKISSTKPENAVISFEGTEGNPAGDGHGWYLYDAETKGVKVTFTTGAPPEGNDTVRVDVKYLIWKDGADMPGEAEAVTEPTYGANQTVGTTITEGGIWHIRYWTESESGLKSDPQETKVYYDPEDSRILTSEIEYTDVNDNPIAHLINWLTFGTFFNEAVRVEIPVEDNFSGAVQLRYQIGGGAEQTEVITEGRTSFEIPLGTKGQIILNVADAAGNVSDDYIMRNLNGKETAWVLENNLPTAQSLNPSLNATGVAVMGEDALTEIELSFSERVVWKEGGQLTISTGEKTYTATMHEDEIPLIPDEGEACTTSVPIERFVDENGEPLKLELNEIYTLVVKAGAFMDYATNENKEALLSAFQTGQELDPGEETPLSNLGLELSEGVTMFPAFDPETTGYTLIIGEEAMDGNHLAQDMVFSPILKGDANIEEAVLTDMMGRELASYEIGADGSFTVPKEAIEEHKNYFIRMTASRYGIETVYNFLVSTSAYNEVITLATSDMSAIEVDGLRNTVDVAEETVEGNKVVVQFVASIPREETTAQQLDPIRAVAGDEKGYYSLDLAINKFRSDGVSEELHELDMPVRITVELPDELLGKDTYEVYRNHEGAVDRLDCTLSADGKRLSFESDRFSFYTIAYTPYTPESTGDNGGSGGGTTTETVYVQVPGGTVTETVYITSGGGRPGSGTVTTVPVTDGSADTEEIPASSPRTDEEPDQTAETEEEETKVTSQEDVLAGIPQGLALADLACMVASMMLAEYSYCKQKKLRKILGTIFAAALIILFFLTQPLEGLIAWTDRWTIFFVITAAVHAIVTVIPQRKDKDGDGEDGQDGAKPAEG